MLVRVYNASLCVKKIQLYLQYYPSPKRNRIIELHAKRMQYPQAKEQSQMGRRTTQNIRI